MSSRVVQWLQIAAAVVGFLGVFSVVNAVLQLIEDPEQTKSARTIANAMEQFRDNHIEERWRPFINKVAKVNLEDPIEVTNIYTEALKMKNYMDKEFESKGDIRRISENTADAVKSLNIYFGENTSVLDLVDDVGVTFIVSEQWLGTFSQVLSKDLMNDDKRPMKDLAQDWAENLARIKSGAEFVTEGIDLLDCYVECIIEAFKRLATGDESGLSTECKQIAEDMDDQLSEGFRFSIENL